MPPRALRDVYKEEELRRFEDPCYLLSQLRVVGMCNLTAQCKYGLLSFQALTQGFIARPKHISSSVDWPQHTHLSSKRFFRVREVASIMRAWKGPVHDESMQLLRYTTSHAAGEEGGMMVVSSEVREDVKRLGRLKTRKVGEPYLEAILFVCRWKVAAAEGGEGGGSVTHVYPELQERFEQQWFVSKLATPDDVSKAVWVAACSMMDAGSLAALKAGMREGGVEESDFLLCQGSLLGKGAFGEVRVAIYKGRNPGMPNAVAVKIMPVWEGRWRPGDEELRGLLVDRREEMLALQRIGSTPYLPTYFGHSLDLGSNKLMVFMSLLEGARLDDIEALHEMHERTLAWIMTDVTRAVCHLHACGGIHSADATPGGCCMDVHGGNVLVSGWANATVCPRLFMARLTDLGSAHIMTDTENSGVAERGFLLGQNEPFAGGGYQAPEYRDGRHGASRKMDVFSLGALAAKVLIHDQNNVMLQNKERPPMLDLFAHHPNVSRDARDFVHTCMRSRPDDRPTAVELKSHRFLSKYQDRGEDAIEEEEGEDD